MAEETPVEQVVRAVRHRHRRQIDAQRAMIDTFVRSGGWSPESAAVIADREFSGQAVLAPAIRVRTSVLVSEMTDLGSFGASGAVMGVMLGVWDDTTADESAVVPLGEAEGWARAVFGPEWSEQAYAVDSAGGDRQWRQGFLVLLDRALRPVAAPPDFFFPAATNGSGRVTVRPLRRTPDGEPAAEFVADLHRAESLLWPVQLIGGDGTGVRPAAEALLAMLRVKGAVHAGFRLVSMAVTGTAAVIGFQRLDTGVELRQTIQLPDLDDLTAGSDYYLRSDPRLPYPPTSPAEWAGFLVAFFQEAFATGFLGRM
ncbi:hypothetical protein ACWIGW_16410 [Nocardia brasiliensis]